MGKSVFHVADAFTYLDDHPPEGALVTSLPDASELGITDLSEYRMWLFLAAELCIAQTSHGHPTVFAQTDRRGWFSKAGVILEAARVTSTPIVWHRIALRRQPGKIDLRRPAYTHLICVGHTRPGKPRPDVIDGSGGRYYPNAESPVVADFCADYVAEVSTALCDPFCGWGSFVHAAQRLGLPAVGIDIDPEQIAHAESLQLIPS